MKNKENLEAENKDFEATDLICISCGKEIMYDDEWLEGSHMDGIIHANCYLKDELKKARQDERKKVLEDLKTKGEVISTWMCPTCGKTFPKAWLKIKKRR